MQEDVMFPTDKEIRFLTEEEIKLLGCIKYNKNNKGCSESLKMADRAIVDYS